MSDNTDLELGNIADNVTGDFSNVSKLVTSASYAAGAAFSAASVLEFKAHKDNPTQVPGGAPTALVAAAVLEKNLPAIEAQAAAAGVTASDVKAAAAKAGITQTDVEAQAAAAGFTSSQISAAESALKAKQSK